MNRWVPLGATALAYAAAWAWIGFVGVANTPAPWVGGNLGVFALISLFAAWWSGWRGALWSVGGLLVGIVLGAVIGDPLHAAQVAKLAQQKLDPSYRQDWEPHQPGWAIALATFLVASAIGVIRPRRRTPGPGTSSDAE